MSIRWISDVPSKIVKIFASRCQRSTGKSRVYPLPPSIWMACSVTRTAVSPANSLDIEPSALANLWPRLAIQAARQVSSLAASTPACMSASMNAIAWFWPIGLPNCTRSVAYSVAYSTAALATPTAIEATVGRDASNVFIAACSPPAPPSASLASRASSFSLPPTRHRPGTLTSSSTTSAVCEARTPSLRNFCPCDRPFVPGPMMKLACPLLPSAGSTDATTTCTSAMPPLVAHALVPFSTHSSVASWYTALVLIAPTSLPASGSDEQNAPSLTSPGPPNICGRNSPTCSGVPLLLTATAARQLPVNDSPMPASPQ